LSGERAKSEVFYGWFVVAACFLLTLTLGETFWSFGVFFKPLEDEFDWSKTLVSSGYTAFLIGYAISIVASGRLVDRISPRPIVLVTGLIAGLGIALCSQVHTINQLRLFLFIAGVGAGPIWTVASSTVMRWFYGKERAGRLALAITSTGVGVGALVFAPLINYFIQDYGWRNAFMYVGIIFSCILVVSSVIIRRSPPVQEVAVSGVDTDPSDREAAPAASVGKMITSPIFLGITLVVTAAIVSFQALAVHLSPYAQDAGISATSAALCLGLLGGFSIPGRILSGAVSDAIGWRRTLALAVFGMALSILWLLFLHGGWMLYCFVLCYGICHGLRIPAQLGIVSDFFGVSSLGVLIGITTAVGQIAGAFAPYMAGFIVDRTGEYSLAFIVLMVVLMGAAIVSVVMRERKSVSG
jgi:OFA family oxalate/formate antiporter-like MFS transporter